MRQRILTTREKEVLEAYLKNPKPSGLIRTLRFRALHFLPDLKEEISLLETFLEKANSKN